MAGGINESPVVVGSLYVYPTKTLSALRDELLVLLGFSDPLTALDAETQTLVELRETIIRRLGQYYVAGGNAPGIDELIDSFINEAHQTVFRLGELDQAGNAFPTTLVNDSDPTVIDYVPVLALALGLAKAHFGQSDAKAYFDQLAKYLADRVSRRPPNVVDLATAWLQKAQNQLYMRYGMLRTERWFNIALAAGERLYDVPTVTGEVPTPFTADFRRISQVWIKDSTRWLPMINGIQPYMFTQTQQTMPTHYEFRQYFEVFPEPDQVYTVYLKGHYGLLPFVADGDEATIDPEPILLQALAWGKAHYGHGDAMNWVRDLNVLIGELNAGTFASKRFIPEPSFAMKPLPYPSVTFAR